MQSLKTIIKLITKGCNLHISILDLVGILDSPMTEIPFENVIHSKEYCKIAKSTDRGYNACLRCKMLANTKAITTKKPFCGNCIYGLYEQAYPVIVNENVVAIIYVGNAVIDKDKTISLIKKTSGLTGINADELITEMENCEYEYSEEELFGIAEIISDYLKLLCNNKPQKPRNLNWLVSLMKRHADEMYCTGVSLKELAISCRKNEKYLGRLFKKEMGISFSEYCIGLRLEKAEAALLKSNDKIIDIALDCGFNNISYFNRVFRKKHNVSPGEYRELKLKNVY